MSEEEAAPEGFATQVPQTPPSATAQHPRSAHKRELDFEDALNGGQELWEDAGGEEQEEGSPTKKQMTEKEDPQEEQQMDTENEDEDPEEEAEEDEEPAGAEKAAGEDAAARVGLLNLGKADAGGDEPLEDDDSL